MTSTLYLNATVYPQLPGGATPLTATAYLASQFQTPPSGYTVPQNLTPAGSGSVVCNPTGSITGLDDTVDYWLLVQNPQGYYHWFNVNWSAGGSSETPMNVNVPAYEGIIVGLINNAVGSVAVWSPGA